MVTTPELEYAFVVDPGAARPWPTEARWEERPGRRRRAPLPLATLHTLLEEKNRQLEELGEPPLSVEEAVGARLYTGPMVRSASCRPA